MVWPVTTARAAERQPHPGGAHPTGVLKEDPHKKGARMLLGVMLPFDLCVDDGNRPRVN